MNMFTASHQPTVRDAAVSYFYEGLSVIPLTGKQCRIKWAIYQDEIALPQTIHHWAKSGVLQNVGIVCGAVSRNLVVMDLDGLAAIEAFEKQFPYLLDTFTVITGSGKGKHLYFRVDDLPPTTTVKYPNHQAIEMRSSGLYVVAPPSLHPETHALYKAMSDAPIRHLPHLNGVKEWIYSLLARKPQTVKPGGQRTIGSGNIPRWAEAALDYECRDVRLSSEGNRNNILNRAAYNLGQIVADGHLSESTVVQSLLSAALTTGLSETEASKSIQGGLKIGLQHPRSTQWQKRKSQ